MYLIKPNEQRQNGASTQKIKENWLKLWGYTKIAVAIGIIAVLTWTLALFITLFTPSIHLTNNLILLGLIFLWWRQNSRGELFLKKIKELDEKIEALESTLTEHMECKACELYPCECDNYDE